LNKNKKPNCIKALQQAALELGESFSMNKYDCWRSSDMPSSDQIRRLFGTFNKAKKAAGLEVNIAKFTSPEHIIKKLRESIEPLGYTPTLQEYTDLKLSPTATTIRSYGLTWGEAMRMAGYSPRKVDFLTTEKMIDRLSKYVASRGRVVSYPQYLNDYKKRDLPAPSVLARNFGSFKKAIEAAGAVTPYRMLEYTKDDLILYLREYHEVYGVAPTKAEWDIHAQEEDLPLSGTYSVVFKRWNAAVKAAGLRPANRRTPYWDKEKILSSLRDHFDVAPLTSAEYRQMSVGHKDIPSNTTVTKYFGTIKNAFKEAGFTNTSDMEVTE